MTTMTPEKARQLHAEAEEHARTTLPDSMLATFHLWDLEPLAEKALEARNAAGLAGGWDHPAVFRLSAVYGRLNAAITELHHATEAMRE